MIHQILHSRQIKYGVLNNKWNNSSLFMKLAKPTKRWALGRPTKTSNSTIVLTELYDARTHVIIENIGIRSLKQNGLR